MFAWRRGRTWGIIAVMGFGVASGTANAQDWPEVFDPYTLLSLHLTMDEGDWNTIQSDDSLSIEVPAMFWADGESPILVNVRRKSGDPIRNGTSFSKVSLKIDVNDLVDGQKWRLLTKLSLENGDDQDVVTEGFAWFMHRNSSGLEGYNLAAPAGLANWATLTINGEYTGVYVNVEQRNKQFLRNHDMYDAGFSWLYKVSNVNGAHDEVVGGDGNSPAYDFLCYPPFRDDCATPSPEVLLTELPQFIEMQTMLTLGAVTSFTGNRDHLFSKGKNFYYVDQFSGRRRLYYPWDLDSSFSRSRGYNIYAQSSEYSQVVLNVPGFRARYSQILNDLICGPLSESELHGFLDGLEPVLTAALAADPNNQLGGSVSGHFDSLRGQVTDRVTEVKGMIEGYVECGDECIADFDGNGTVNTRDFVAYLSAWADRDPSADLNGDGVVNTQDFLVFLGLWAAGC